MDFGKLLHVAKKNSSEQNGVRCYSTKFSPPKKESKDKNLSSGIQRFLAKRDEEEREKERQLRENRERLEAMRDNKSKNKITKMLKVIKSANKSVVSDTEAAQSSSPSLLQPDDDDYGYESQESSVLYKRLMEKFKTPEDENKNTIPAHTSSTLQPRRSTPAKRPPPQSVSVASKNGSCPPSKSSSSSSKLPPPGTAKGATQNNGNSKAPPTAIKQKQRRPPPPVVNFEALLKLAEQKQFEPIKVDAGDKGGLRKDDRPMSAKEKRDHEERMRMAEARKRRLDNDNYDYRKTAEAPGSGSGKSKSAAASSPPGPSSSLVAAAAKRTASTIRPISATATTANRSQPSAAGSKAAMATNANKTTATGSSNTKAPPTAPVKTRQFPPPDVERTRSFPPEDVQRRPQPSSRPFPPADVRRKPTAAYSSSNYNKRPRIEDEEADDYGDYEDEDEYDSEMDDFIDDGPLGQADVSSCIKEIFGYDKNRYRDEDFDDREMESSFAQQMREESYSRKVGRMEDAADMRQEALDKARKAALKRADKRH